MPKNKQKTNSDSTQSTLSDKKEKFLEILELNSGNVQESCKRANIGRRTYYSWKEVDQDFADACVDVKEGLLDFAESQLQGLIKANNVIATIFFLKCKGKSRGYTEKQELELVRNIDDIKFDEL